MVRLTRLAPIVCALTACISLGQTTKPAVRTGRPLPELKFDGTSLADALDFFRDSTGVNMIVDWPALELAGATKQTPVTLRLRAPVFRVALRKTLDAAAAGGVLDYYVDENVLHVTTKAVADARLVTRVYAVGDLLVDVPDYQGPELSLQSSNSGSRSGGGGGGGGSSANAFSNATGTSPNLTRSAAGRADALIDLIRTTIRPEVWDVNGGKATIRHVAGNLVVTAPVSVQEAIGGR